MGAWGERIYQNDAALDTLDALTGAVEWDASPIELVVGSALRIWLLGDETTNFEDALSRYATWFADFPAARSEVEAFRDNDGFESARCEDIQSILGVAATGPRLNTLLTLPSADRVITALAARCRALLAQAAAQKTGFSLDGLTLTSFSDEGPSLYDYDGVYAALGVLVDLDDLRPAIPANDIQTWREALVRAEKCTDGDEEFWQQYYEYVRKSFAVLERDSSR